ncbi:unnamed protein product [Paramecium primaurelia]|uniref:Cytosol aminopeptidase domain-containing protein n=1 Tax=Paramecium primaurelia TaxID=5886 RepID=A0A8S1JR52_PARPR|nr:unnamed protein product [Paramecium primaurelia]
MQKHTLMETTPHIEIKHTTQAINKGVYVLYYPSINESADPIVKALQFYFKSKELLKDINSGKSAKIYALNDTDPFEYVIIQNATSPRMDGANLARKASNKIANQKSEDNSISVLLPHNYTVNDIAEFSFGFQLANYRWTYQSIKEGGKSSSFPINYLNLITSITQEEYLNQVEQHWNLKYLHHLVKPILRLRELVPTRPNIATTGFMKNYILDIVKGFGDKVTSTLIEGDELLGVGLRLIHAVGRGSIHKPFYSCLSYKGNAESDKYYALVGKGVVFDSGGLSIKTTSSMEQMYDDKGGACTVLETFRAVVELGLPINVVCSTAWVENSVGPDSYRVSDVIQSYKGITVEILNTDAEGRLILADAMSYAQDKFQIQEMIELSTLTGIIKNALGRYCGVFTNRKGCFSLLRKVEKITKEPFWALPLEDQHRELIKGSVADINNSSSGRVGASAAAAFLECFVEKKVRWMHWDIANVAVTDKNEGIYTKGGTGFGVMSLIYYMTWDIVSKEIKEQKQENEDDDN